MSVALQETMQQKPIDVPIPAAEAPAEPEAAQDLPEAPAVLSDLLKAPEVATEPLPPSSTATHAAASPDPPLAVAPQPKAESNTASPISVLVHTPVNACHC